MTKKGFTLAEVLITLTVLGVVAALAIPAILNSVGTAQYKSSVRKASATLNSAIRFRMLRTGQLVTGVSSQKDLADLFKEDLNAIRTRGNNVVYTTDSMSYTFLGSNCETTDIADRTWEGSACRVIVDVNGDNGPNQSSDEENAFRDQYRFVITTNDAVPAEGSFATRALIE